MAAKPHRYTAFISYSHSEDSRFAPALQRALETFAKPWYRGRSIPLFRDTTNLSANPDLWASIEQALAGSEFFLLLASPLSSRSKWVEKELAYWRRNRDTSKLILVLTDGTIAWSAASGDFDWAVTDALPRSIAGTFSSEPLFIDFRAFKGEKASLGHPEFLDRIATLAATLRGVDKDTIAGEHVRQHRRTIRTAAAAVAVLFVLAAVASIFGVVSQQRGRRIDAQNMQLKESFVGSQISLGTALIREGRMAEGLWHYWLAYDNTTPDAAARQSALNLIGSWSALAGRPLVTDHTLRQVAFSADGRTALTVTDRAAQSWDVQTGEPLAERVAASDVPWQSAAVSADAATLIVARGGRADVWDIRSGRQRGTPLEHGDTISKVAFSADGTTALTQSTRRIRLWDVRSGARVGRDVATPSAQYAVLAPDGRSLLLGLDQSRLVNVASGESTSIPFWPHHDRSNRMAVFSPDGALVIAAGNTDEEVRDYERAEVWRVGSSTLVANTMSHRGRFTALVFGPDGEVLSGGDDNTAYLWRLSGEKLTRQGPPLVHGGSVVTAAFGRDRARATTMVLTGSTDQTARLWKLTDLTTTVQTAYPLRHGGSVDSVALSADAQTALTGGSDGIARLWSPFGRVRKRDSTTRDDTPVGVGGATLESPAVAAVATREPSATLVAVGPDKTVAAFRGDDGTVRLRRVPSGEVVGKALRPRGAVLAVAFSPDGRLVALGSTDNTATVWDARTGDAIGTPLNHEDAVSSVEFSPDRRTLLTGSGDTKARLWDVASGSLLGDPFLHAYKVQRAYFSRDGRAVTTRAAGPYVSDDGHWNAPAPAADQPECLKLSLEWRTGYRIDAAQQIVRLTQAEWLASKRKLAALGGPCDAGR